MAEAPVAYGWSPGAGIALQEKLRQDLKLALRGRNEVLKSTIRQIMAEFFKLTVPVTLEGGKRSTRPKRAEEITDDEIVGIIQGLVKSEQIVLAAKKASGSEYLRILEAYLPRPASDEQIVAWIRANVDFSRYKNRMQAMGAIMQHFGKAADGKRVNRILAEWQP
jgi:hypothetical protein